MNTQEILQDYALVRQFVIDRIPTVLKQGRGYIHHPFIDPGSVYDGNVWDWDTYWSVYGLLPLLSDIPQDLQKQVLLHAQGNVRNFLDHQCEDGYIPMMIEYKGEQEPYLVTKHKEGRVMNMHKPFLCRQICLISEYLDDYAWIINEHRLEQLQRYFSCYDTYYLHASTGLYVWADDIMIGVDNDPATFGRPGFSTANIYLNSFLVGEFQAMAEILGSAGRTDEQRYFLEKAERLSSLVRSLMFDERDGFFYSQDVDIKTRQFDWFHKGLGVFWKSLPIKVQVWSGFIPLYEGIATQEQAARLVQRYHQQQAFSCPFGITTLSQDETMFSLEATNNPSNWLGPIWLVSNYVVAQGFRRYGYEEEANEIALKSLQLLARDIRTRGELHEFYHPFTGEPVMNGGFINWNILCLNMIRLYLEDFAK